MTKPSPMTFRGLLVALGAGALLCGGSLFVLSRRTTLTEPDLGLWGVGLAALGIAVLCVVLGLSGGGRVRRELAAGVPVGFDPESTPRDPPGVGLGIGLAVVFFAGILLQFPTVNRDKASVALLAGLILVAVSGWTLLRKRRAAALRGGEPPPPAPPPPDDGPRRPKENAP